MNWFEISIKDLLKIVPGQTHNERLINALDVKYGNYDYSEDLRSLKPSEFKKFFQKLLKTLTHKSKIIVCGANSGYEINQLEINGFHVTGLDLSNRALKKLKTAHPKVSVVHDNINELPFKDNTFDIYIAMRTLQCRTVDLPQAILECLRVTKPNGKIIISIPNGYLVDNKVIKGMYIHENKKFNKKKPYEIVSQIQKALNNHQFPSEITEITSEIIITAN